MEYKEKLKMCNIKFPFYLLVFLLIPSCMFYSFKGSLPAHIGSIYLAPVVNESTEFIVETKLNEELNNIMLEENVLDIRSYDFADSQLEVVIKSVTDLPYTIFLSKELGMEEVEEWRLTINTSVTWYDIKRDENIITKKMSSFGIYLPGVDIGSDNIDNDGDCTGDTNLDNCICCSGDENVDENDSDEIGSPRESAMNISIRRLTQDIVSEITNTW